ncbi:16422_t:CDS:2 [Dentiscutata erythropus]|uniref:16422_t:CDS:1 n=1 Tax=Dentiscutata erythropus TaxID=1348616 RepID=A0A9N8WRE7_9GLOM|nr:16422_t:CDS:2 [Dentiscutata erythropus]
MSPPRRSTTRNNKRVIPDFLKRFGGSQNAVPNATTVRYIVGPHNAWATLVPSDNRGLPSIYLTEKMNYLGNQQQHNEPVFRRLPADPRIDNIHCSIFKEQVEGIGTIVKLQNLSRNGAVKVLERELMSNQFFELKEGDSIKFPSSKGDWYSYSIEIDLKPEGRFHNDYRIKGILGTGHFGEVKLATLANAVGNESKFKEYAVKIIDKNTVSKKPNTKLHDEIIIMHKIEHKSLVRIRNLYNERDKLYLVMDYIKDGEFFDFISKKKKLTEYETRIIFRQLFEAMKYLHDHRIVHRDLKPENILMSNKEKLEVKITDFGLSKLLGPEYSLMKTMCGTPLYIAPEVLDRSPRRSYGKAVDMWSLGVILYVCLCGYPPFAKDFGPPSFEEQIKLGIYRFYPPSWSYISNEAKDLIKGLLNVNVRDRLTASQALVHPFMQMLPLPQPVTVVPNVNNAPTLPRVSSNVPPSDEVKIIFAQKLSALSKRAESGDDVDDSNDVDTASYVTADTIVSSKYFTPPVQDESIYYSAIEFNSSSFGSHSSGGSFTF